MTSIFGQKIRKRVPSRIQRKKRNVPDRIKYQPNAGKQVSLDSAIKNESDRKQMNRQRRKDRLKSLVTRRKYRG